MDTAFGIIALVLQFLQIFEYIARIVALFSNSGPVEE